MLRNSRLFICWSAGLIRMGKENGIPTSSSLRSGSLFYRSMSYTFSAPTLCGVFILTPSGNALHLHWIPFPVYITILSMTSAVFFSHSSTRTHGFLLFVWLLSVCHQQAHNFPTAECVILAPAVLSPSRKHTVFLNGFPDELGHFSQEASVGPNSFLFTHASVCSMRRATSDDFLPTSCQ